jgi:hypothetical protein
MDKSTLGLIAALGAATAVSPAAANAPAAATAKILQPTSVAELLEPIADPVATLSALQAERANKPVQVANDVTIGVPGVTVHHHHHHYHHRRYVIVHHHHHHHHHHYNNY